MRRYWTNGNVLRYRLLFLVCDHHFLFPHFFITKILLSYEYQTHVNSVRPVSACVRAGCGPDPNRTQQRQTTMAQVTLFINLITMRLKPKEKITGLYGRILEIKARLENWDPPIYLPDKLFMVCMIRLLDYHVCFNKRE